MGTSKISYADNIRVQDGDIISIQADCFHFPLVNEVKKAVQPSFNHVKYIG
jgi:hypothetical protein